MEIIPKINNSPKRERDNHRLGIGFLHGIIQQNQLPKKQKLRKLGTIAPNNLVSNRIVSINQSKLITWQPRRVLQLRHLFSASFLS